MKTPRYTCTNENLKEIIRGLRISSSDTILAIGGSGDQAFAMLLDSPKKIVVVDSAEEQVDHIKKQMERMHKELYWDFLRSRLGGKFNQKEPDKFEYNQPLNRQEVDSYNPGFFTIRKLRNIRPKLGRIEIALKTIDEALVPGVFNKIYLSNAIFYGQMYEDGLTTLLAVKKSLPRGGLIYCTNGGSVYGLAKETGLKIKTFGNSPIGSSWSPIVLEKK